MLVAVALAGAIAAGLDWRVVALAAAAAWRPVATVVLAAGWAVVAAARRRAARTVAPAAEAAFLAAVAAELRGGSSLRWALVNAVADAPGLDLGAVLRRARAGLPVEALAAEIATGLPTNGPVAAAAIDLTARTGARAAATFEALADRAGFTAELARERRALTAQARLSAVVVGGAPVLLAVGLLASGRGATLLAHGTAGVAVGLVGIGLLLTGLVAVIALSRRTR